MSEVKVAGTFVASLLEVPVLGVIRANLERSVALLLGEDDRPAELVRPGNLVVLRDLVELEDSTTS